jgi:hypothetical protein
VYEKRFVNGNSASFKCESCSTIAIIWANYGVQVPNQYPFAISTSSEDCVTTNAKDVVQKKCNGKTQCSFVVKNSDFLKSESICKTSLILLVRFKCARKIPGMLLIIRKRRIKCSSTSICVA